MVGSQARCAASTSDAGHGGAVGRPSSRRPPRRSLPMAGVRRVRLSWVGGRAYRPRIVTGGGGRTSREPGFGSSPATGMPSARRAWLADPPLRHVPLRFRERHPSCSPPIYKIRCKLDYTAAIAIPAIRRRRARRSIGRGPVRCSIRWPAGPTCRRRAALDDTVRDTGSGLRRHRAYQPGYRQMVARMCRRGQIVVLIRHFSRHRRIAIRTPIPGGRARCRCPGTGQAVATGRSRTPAGRRRQPARCGSPTRHRR
jgi:hypothetical protein